MSPTPEEGARRSPKKPTRTLGSITRQQRPAATQSLRGLASGESVWVKRYDPKTGELSSQFKGERYDPQKHYDAGRDKWIGTGPVAH